MKVQLIVFWSFLGLSTYAQSIDSLEIKIKEAMELAKKERISQGHAFDTDFLKYTPTTFIKSFERYFKENPNNFDNYYCNDTYNFGLQLLLYHTLSISDRHLIIDKLLSVCDDTLKRIQHCRNYSVQLLDEINPKTDTLQVKKIVSLLNTPFYDKEHILWIGSNDLYQAKNKLIELRVKEAKNTNEFLEINKSLARLGDKTSLDFCLKIMKENYQNGDKATRENYEDWAPYIAQPEIINFFIKELDSKRTIVLDLMSIYDEEKGVGENVKVTVTIAQLAVRILHYLIPEMPKFYTNSNYNKSNVWVPKYKIWLKKNGGKYKINRMNRFNIFEI